MKERERILDLVKKGILTSEEALVLLENMSEKEQNIPTTDKEEPEAVADQKQALEDKEALEQALDDLTTKANQISAGLDGKNAAIKSISEETKQVQEKLMQLNTKEELDALSDDELAQRETYEATLKSLEEKLAAKQAEKKQLEDEMKAIRKDQWQEAKEKVATKLDLPEDWKEQATDTFTQVGEKMSEAGSQLGSFLKQTFHTFTETVNDNLEWKDINLKVPGVVTTKFDHEFYYPAPQASLIDIKIANGNITFKTWDQEDLKVEGKIKLFGKMDAQTPLEAFLERSEIEVDDELISFQIPNKRVRADLVFYLPQRMYDHVSVKILNGAFTVEKLQGKDIYTKSTNGALTFHSIEATMLEVQGVNGDIQVKDGQILDTIIETVNGTVTCAADIQNLGITLVNGDVKIMAKGEDLRKIEATSVNGNVKISCPATLGLEGTVKTSLGSINSRLTNYEVIREKKEKTNQLLQFRRLNEENMTQINAATTTGNIYLKDVE